MAAVVEEPALSAFGLFELDEPLALFLLPVGAYHLGIEVHVLPQTPDLTDFVQVLPNVGAVAEEARPVRVQGKGIGVGMGWDVAGRTRVAVLEPSSPDICVLFVYDMVYVLEKLLDMVCVHYTSYTSANAEYLDLPGVGSMQNDVGDGVV